MGNRNGDSDDDQSDDDSTDNHDDDDSSSRRRRRHTSNRKDHHKSKRSSSSSKHHKKRKNRHKDDRKKKRSKYSDDSSSSQASDRESSHSDTHDRRDRSRDRKRRKKDRRKEPKREKKTSKRRRKEEEAEDQNRFEERNREIADSILDLLSSHPELATELPAMLIRMAGGASFDLSQMTNVDASSGLERVFQTLEPFGVTRANHTWMWKSPHGSSTSNNELLLIRVIRSLLDQMGLTMSALDAFEASLKQAPPRTNVPSAAPLQPQLDVKLQSTLPDNQTSELAGIEQLVSDLLLEFGPDKLAGELAGLVDMLLQGECISLEGLPDATLRTRLEQLLVECGMELQEMEGDGESDEEDGSHEETNDEPASMGYALPDESTSVEALCRAKLAMVLKVCREGPVAAKTRNIPSTSSSRRPIQGPMMHPEAYAASAPDRDSSGSDDEGPAPRTAVAKRKGPQLPPDALQAQAARRTLELECAKAGISPPIPSVEGQREEWMLVPGKFDFLGSIKSGQTMKSRTFEGKRSNNGPKTSSLDPAVRAEIDQIMQAHEQARGPSLMEVHRERKKAEKAAAAAARQGNEKKAAWTWKRDKDLESGRGVDRNALNMIYGGASSDLKNKFQGGFG